MQRTSEETREIVQRIFAKCESIYREEHAKIKRKKLRKRFKQFITMRVYNVTKHTETIKYN